VDGSLFKAMPVYSGAGCFTLPRWV